MTEGFSGGSPRHRSARLGITQGGRYLLFHMTVLTSPSASASVPFLALISPGHRCQIRLPEAQPIIVISKHGHHFYLNSYGALVSEHREEGDQRPRSLATSWMLAKRTEPVAPWTVDRVATTCVHFSARMSGP